MKIAKKLSTISQIFLATQKTMLTFAFSNNEIIITMRLLSIKRYGVKLKATVQATGKLGFPKATSDILRFDDRPNVQFFLDDNETDLFMVVLDEPNGDAFKAIASSGYYSINTAAIFDELNYDYKDKKKSYVFDLIRSSQFDTECGGEVYKMVLREEKEKVKQLKFEE